MAEAALATDLLHEAKRIAAGVDRLFEDAFTPFYSGRDGGGATTGQTGVQSLPVTIWETDDGFHAALVVPLIAAVIGVAVTVSGLRSRRSTSSDVRAGCGASPALEEEGEALTSACSV